MHTGYRYTRQCVTYIGVFACIDCRVVDAGVLHEAGVLQGAGVDDAGVLQHAVVLQHAPVLQHPRLTQHLTTFIT